MPRSNHFCFIVFSSLKRLCILCRNCLLSPKVPEWLTAVRKNPRHKPTQKCHGVCHYELWLITFPLETLYWERLISGSHSMAGGGARIIISQVSCWNMYLLYISFYVSFGLPKSCKLSFLGSQKWFYWHLCNDEEKDARTVFTKFLPCTWGTPDQCYPVTLFSFI